MLSIGFGMNAPIAWDAMLVAGDELVVGFLIVVLVALSQSVRAASAGVVLALLVLSTIVLPLDLALLQASPWLPVGSLLTGVSWMIRSILIPNWRSGPGQLRHFNLGRSIWPRLDFVGAVFAAFSVVILLGIETKQELLAIAQPDESILPLTLGFVAAAINVFCVGALLGLLFSKIPSLSQVQLTGLLLVTGALLVSFGAYCAGRSLRFHWPGDELAIGVMALALWLIGQAICRLASIRKHA